MLQSVVLVGIHVDNNHVLVMMTIFRVVGNLFDASLTTRSLQVLLHTIRSRLPHGRQQGTMCCTIQHGTIHTLSNCTLTLPAANRFCSHLQVPLHS